MKDGGNSQNLARIARQLCNSNAGKWYDWHSPQIHDVLRQMGLLSIISKYIRCNILESFSDLSLFKIKKVKNLGMRAHVFSLFFGYAL